MLRSQRTSRSTSPAGLTAAILLIWLGTTSPAAAEPPGTPAAGPSAGAEATTGTTECTRLGALSAVSCELSRALGRQRAALVAAAPLATDQALTKPDRVLRQLVKVVAGALEASAHDTPVDLTRARSLASAGSGQLVYLEVALKGGELQVTADLYPVPRNFWDRVRDPEPNPTGHAFVSHRIDAELSSYLPSIPLVAGKIHRVPAPDRSVVALACGDALGRGDDELVVVGRHRVAIGRLVKGKFRIRAQQLWSSLSPIAGTPLREPIGGVSLTSGSYVDIGTTDRASGVRLSPSLALQRLLREPIPWAPEGCTRRSGLGLRASAGTCSVGPQPAPAASKQTIDALAGADLLDRSGKPFSVRASRITGETSAWVRDDRGHAARVGPVGAQLAVGDLDRDGQAELLAASSTRNPRADAIIVYTFSGKTLRERFRVPAPGGVKALAVCPPGGLGRSAIAAAVGKELWVIE